MKTYLYIISASLHGGTAIARVHYITLAGSVVAMDEEAARREAHKFVEGLMMPHQLTFTGTTIEERRLGNRPGPGAGYELTGHGIGKN